MVINDTLVKVVDNRGKTPPTTTDGHFLLEINCIAGAKKYPDYSQVKKFVSEGTYNTWFRSGHPQKGDILIPTVGTLDAIAVMDRNDCCIAQNMIAFRTDPDICNNEYLYYYLCNPIVRKRLLNLDIGGVQPSIKVPHIKKLEIDIPKLDEQRKIASVLSAIDEKIQLNYQINDNLLLQARTLFTSWFVDFAPFSESMVETPAGFMAPQSLRMIQIQDLPHILETGKRPKGGAVADGVPSIGAENVKALGVFDTSSAKFIPHDFAALLKKGRISGYELLLYKDGGKPGTFIPHFSMFGEGFPYKEFFINEHVFKLDFFDHGYNEFAYFYLQTDYPYHWLASNGGKAAIPGINQQDVNSIWIYHPSHPKVREFCEWIQPLFTTILSNCAQNMKLSILRDTLLPRLMSSEIDVSDISV